MNIEFPSDLVGDLRSGRTTEDEASAVFDALTDAGHEGLLDRPWWQVVGLSIDQATVLLHGGSWAEVLAAPDRGQGDGS